MAGEIADVDGDGGVHDPAVDVDADVELGEVALGIAGLLGGGGTVVGGDVVAGRLDGERAAGAVASDLLFNGHANVAHARPRDDQTGADVADLGGHPPGLAQAIERMGSQGRGLGHGGRAGRLGRRGAQNALKRKRPGP